MCWRHPNCFSTGACNSLRPPFPALASFRCFRLPSKRLPALLALPSVDFHERLVPGSGTDSNVPRELRVQRTRQPRFRLNAACIVAADSDAVPSGIRVGCPAVPVRRCCWRGDCRNLFRRNAAGITCLIGRLKFLFRFLTGGAASLRSNSASGAARFSGASVSCCGPGIWGREIVSYFPASFLSPNLSPPDCSPRHARAKRPDFAAAFRRRILSSTWSCREQVSVASKRFMRRHLRRRAALHRVWNGSSCPRQQHRKSLRIG